MIPAIGIMIAAYIITRMLELIASKAERVVKIFACGTILVTIVSIIDIVRAGSRATGLN